MMMWKEQLDSSAQGKRDGARDLLEREFPRRLRRALHYTGLTQEGLALRAGLTQSQISAYLRGDNLPSLVNFSLICAALEYPPGFLLGFSEPDESNGRPVPLLKAAEVARILNVDPSRVYTLIHQGKIRPVKIGARSMRVQAEEVQRFIERGKCATF